MGFRKPVGNSDAYSDRNSSGQNGQNEPDKSLAGDLLGSVLSSNNNSGSVLGSLLDGGSSGGSSNKSSAGCSGSIFKKILLIILIIVAIYFVYKLFFAPNADDNGSINSNTSSQSASTDAGAYEADTTVSSLARAKRTVLKGGGEDTVTVMVYMCGTDLESKYGMGTSDLQEMSYAEISDRVNVILETGGTSQWQNSVISSGTNQRYKVTSDGLELLEKNLGKQSMVEPETLTEFIDYCETQYPADRYILVLWDHGGGSISGYGYDELFPGNTMTLDKIDTALKNADCKFDIIGFDACLMATLETATTLERYSDYLIASEETEPAYGWYYTDWITALSKNTSISSVKLGKQIIDDFVRVSAEKTPDDMTTLSLIDLAELSGTVPKVFRAFAAATDKLIDENGYETVSDARSSAREFASQNQLNQIDLIHFTENLGTAQAKELAEVLRGCIKYNRTCANMTNANGLSIYFPYDSLNKVGDYIETYESVGLDETYSECVKSFASVAAGGQVTSSASGGLLDVLSGSFSQYVSEDSSSATSTSLESVLSLFLDSGDYSSILGAKSVNWLDKGLMLDSAQYYADNRLDAAALQPVVEDDQRVLKLTEEQWALVQKLELNIFLDDGEGYIDLGLDNVFEFTDSGDLLMEYDGTWLALDGQIISYYMLTESGNGDDYTITGRVPALLNGQLVDIILQFTDENPYGVVAGAKTDYDGAVETVAKGLIEIKAGDQIDFLCDYYTYGGDYNDTYHLGEQMIFDGEWDIGNASVGDSAYVMTYRITDLYGNGYWTQAITG